jgi:hypothetical protein
MNLLFNVVINIYMRNAYRIFVWKYEGEEVPERPSCRWEDNLEIDFVDVKCESVESIYLALNRVKWCDVSAG